MHRSPSQLLIMATAAVGLGAASHLVAQPASFDDVTEVVAIEVPVQVIKDGDPVAGLTADNFEITDGRKKRTITGFQEINLALLGPDPDTGVAPLLPVTARRHFLFLFDLSFSRPDSVTKARAAAQGVVAERIHSTDLMAVGTYSASKGFRLVLGFTSDRAQVEYAIETMGLANPLTPVEDPLGLLIADLTGQAFGGGSSQQFSGSGITAGGGSVDVEGEILANLRDLQGLSSQAAIDEQKNRVLSLTSSMGTVAGLLRTVDGRVQVVLLSEGFDTSVMMGNQGFTQAERDAMTERAENIASGETWKVNNDATYGSGAAMSGMNQMLEEFRRADAVINAVDIGGLRVGGTVDKGSSRGNERSEQPVCDGRRHRRRVHPQFQRSRACDDRVARAHQCDLSVGVSAARPGLRWGVSSTQGQAQGRSQGRPPDPSGRATTLRSPSGRRHRSSVGWRPPAW